jgi:hypothetical protein
MAFEEVLICSVNECAICGILASLLNGVSIVSYKGLVQQTDFDCVIASPQVQISVYPGH